MSMSDLVSGGAGCGPSNPLQNIGKRFGQDRGAQQDSFASSPFQQQGPASFRSNVGAGSSQQQQAAFFNTPAQQVPFAQQNHDAFDVSQLRGNLPSGSRTPMQAHARPSVQQAPSMADLEASFRPVFQNNAPAAQRAAPSGWATDFLSAEAAGKVQLQQPQQMHNEQQHHAVHTNVIPMGLRMGGMMPMQFQPSPMQEHVQHQSMQVTPAPQVDNAKWAEAFTAFEASSKPAEAQPVVEQARPVEKVDYNDPQEKDELARTAGRLVSSVEHDQSAKFKQSNFLDLMRKIRDKQAGIQGDNIVETSNMPETLDKGKARETPQTQNEAYAWANRMGSTQLPPTLQKNLQQNYGLQSGVAAGQRMQQEVENQQALNDLWAEEDARSAAIEREAMAKAFVGDGGNVEERMREDDADAREFEKYQRLGANIPHASTFNRRWEEDMDRGAEMEDDELDFVGRRWEGTKGMGLPSAQTAEWDKLQSDWDNFEVTSAGIRPVTMPQRAETSTMQAAPQYRFLSDNPYMATTRHHAVHAGGLPAGLESVLEKEAAVQQDPSNASAWYDLGVKQQENEREVQAIAALRKALDLDPNLKDAWLALAVSYTNENDRTAAYDAIEQWIDRNDKYRDVLARASAELANSASDQRNRSDSVSSHSTSASVLEKHSRLTHLLIAMVRSGGERGEIDADVQVALGVIFNSSEDYDKAVDCFSTALSVRPQDWLLYNRLGATLSNSGRSAEAIQYYHHALNLQPEFVRCHFNLSISCLNLKMYQDAAEHIYTALTLQQAEAETLGMVGGDTNSNVTSGSLWETFRVALELLNRSDLAAKCASRDINAFDLSDFVAPPPGNVGGMSEVGTCFDTCVSTDPLTDSNYIPASARVDPSSLPFYPLSPSSSDAKVNVTLFHLGTIHSYRQCWADDTWDKDDKRRLEKSKRPVELPVLSALIEHEPTGEKWLWDLGMSNDSKVLPEIFTSGAIKFMSASLSDKGQLKNVLLKKFQVESIDQVGLSGLILSHAHVDHYGNLLDFPTSLPVFVGGGTMEWVGGGDEAAKKGEKGLMSFSASFLKNRTFIEMPDVASKAEDKVKARVKEVKVGPFEKAWDWFGDGSLVLASAEGHCPGHMVCLAKTTSGSQPTYVVLSGDAAHQQNLYHPLPPPLQLNQESLSSPAGDYCTSYSTDKDLRATPGYFDRSVGEAVVDRAIPEDKASCMQDFPDKAMRTLAALSRMEACADVMVVLAHEIEFAQAVGIKEGDEVVINDWRSKGMKDKKIELGRQAREKLASL